MYLLLTPYWHTLSDQVNIRSIYQHPIWTPSVNMHLSTHSSHTHTPHTHKPCQSILLLLFVCPYRKHLLFGAPACSKDSTGNQRRYNTTMTTPSFSPSLLLLLLLLLVVSLSPWWHNTNTNTTYNLILTANPPVITSPLTHPTNTDS